MLKNKRGVEINITTIVILVLAILVLVVLAIGFSIGFDNLWKMIMGRGAEYREEDLRAKRQECQNRDLITYCTENVSIYNIKTNEMKSVACYADPIFADLRNSSGVIIVRHDPLGGVPDQCKAYL